MRKPKVPFVTLWATDRGLTVLLGFLVLFLFVGYPLIEFYPVAKLLVDLLFTMILISGVVATAKSPRLTIVITALAAMSLCMRVLRYQSPSVFSEASECFSAIIFLGLLTSLVLYQVFRDGPITRQRIEGAVAVYLLLGLAWGFAYSLIELAFPGAFSFTNPVGPKDPHLLTPRLTYFSFVTLTTLGYGDITPVAPISRSLVILEALTGQLFPSILLARLVSLELEYRHERRRERS